MLKCLVLNLKTPISNQDGISAYNISTISARRVMTINKDII